MSAAPVQDVQQLIERVGTLPRLPLATVRLLGVINDPRSTLKDIVGIIKYDQSVTAELLKLVNSAAMALVRKIHSVDEAVCYLGTTRVMQILLAAHTKTLLGPPQSGYGLAPGALWSHCVAVAIACQALARRLNLEDAGLLFTAGLLHDVGKVVLNEAVDGSYARIVGLVQQKKLTFSQAERELFGFTHAEIGARIAERWSLPDAIVECIRLHHEPDANKPDTHVDVVHLADVICLLTGIGAGDDAYLHRAEPGVLERLALRENDIAVIGADVIAEYKLVQKLFASPLRR